MDVLTAIFTFAQDTTPEEPRNLEDDRIPSYSTCIIA
jgi:hypothetical protein